MHTPQHCVRAKCVCVCKVHSKTCALLDTVCVQNAQQKLHTPQHCVRAKCVRACKMHNAQQNMRTPQHCVRAKHVRACKMHSKKCALLNTACVFDHEMRRKSP